MSGEGGASHGQEHEAAPVRVSVGDVLRGERERRSLSLDDVAANLRIRRAQIDAIEDGRFKELPGAPYAVGFVKAYAEFLELDRDEIVRRFKEEAAGLDSHKELNFPRPLTESRLPGGVLLLLSAVIAASAYAVWYFQSSSDRAVLPRVAAVPERLAPLAEPRPATQPEAQAPEATPAAAPMTSDPASAQKDPAPIETAAAPAAAVEPPKPATPAPEATSTAAAAPAAPVPSTPPATSTAPAASTPTAPSASSAASTSTTAPPATSVASGPAPAATPSTARPEAAAIPAAPMDVSTQPRVYGESAASRIMIRATADSWIQVRDPSGAVVFTRVLRAGDSYRVPNSQGLFLYTGSAGALEISVDGKIAPSIGQPGAVRRDVMLDPERLAAGTAVLDQKRPVASDAPRPSQASSSASERDLSRQ